MQKKSEIEAVDKNFKYDKRIVPGCKVKITKLDPSIPDYLLYTTELVDQVYIRETFENSSIRIGSGWYLSLDQVEFVEDELTFEDFKPGMKVQIKPNVETFSVKFLPGGVYLVERKYGCKDNYVIVLADCEGNTLEFSPNEVDIIPCSEEVTKPEVKPTQNNIKIEFFNKETGVILEGNLKMFIDQSGKVYEQSPTSLIPYDVSDTTGFRIIVKG